MKKSLIIIPTYNELDNIQKLIPDLFDLYPANVELLIVDDNSPDGTAEYVEKMMQLESRLHILKRPRKMGLGTAYCAGFKYAIENKYDFVFEMDADYSHDPREIKNFLKAIEDSDLVIGSRYLTGVNVINWPMHRLILSYTANKYSRVVTGMPIYDCTAGFKCFRREALEAIDFSKITSNGYAFQIEMHFKIWKKGFRVKEIPIIFIDRQQGLSKMSKKIIWEAMWLVWRLRISHLLGRL